MKIVPAGGFPPTNKLLWFIEIEKVNEYLDMYNGVITAINITLNGHRTYIYVGITANHPQKEKDHGQDNSRV